ncbi:MAG: MotA/TolQ/ExbB proton channel family protein, partial [Limisphaerales bacterium]
DQISARQEAKLEDAVQRLKQQRQTIFEAQIPLAKELSELQIEAKALRNQLAERRAVRDSASVSLEKLREQVKSGEREHEYISGALVAEFVSTYQSALSAGEIATYGESIRQHNLKLGQPETSETNKLATSLELLGESITRLDELVGGKTYPGDALGGDGRLKKGRFAQVGPLLYFSMDAGDAGWVEETKSEQARLRPMDIPEADLVRNVAKNASGDLPIDTSLGDAIAMAETKETVTEHLEKGGIWVYPIVAFALLASVVALFKCFQVFLIRQPKPMVVHEIVHLLRDGKKQEALALASAQPEPARDMLKAAVEHSEDSIELVEEVMYESMLSTQPRLERFLNVIAVTAATAPLLGLLGTVTGIIKTFKLMEVFGAGDPKPLISGISEALITTELGLVLAIPALIAHAMLSRRVAGVLARLEKLSVAFVNGLSRRPLTATKPGGQSAD